MGAALFALGVGTATAADLPIWAPGPTGPVLLPFTWAGPYFGVNIGAGANGFQRDVALEHHVAGKIDRTHGAAAKHGNELVAAKAFLLVTGHDVTGDGLNVAWENARKTR